MEVKKPFRFSEVHNLDSNCGENRSPEGRRKRKAIAKRSSKGNPSTVAVQPCAEVTKQIEAMNNSTGLSSNTDGALSVPPRYRNEVLLLSPNRETMKPAEQVPVPQLASCFSMDSGHGEDLSSSCESGAIYLQTVIHVEHRDCDSNDEEVFEDALSDIGEVASDSDSSSAYLTPRSQSFADLSSLNDSICPASGDMDLPPNPPGITQKDQTVLSDSLPIARSSTPFEGVTTTHTPICKFWDISLPQTLLYTCPSYSPQDSAIGSSSPQSINNSPFSFPAGSSSPSPPLSQTTPIGHPEGEWPDLTSVFSVIPSPPVPTTVEPSTVSQSMTFEPSTVSQSTLPRSTDTPVLGDPILAQPSSHSLHCSWVMWFDRCGAASRNDYQSSLEHLSSVQCIEDFWRVFNNLQLPSQLTNANYHFFKENIAPLWEDPSNCHGGKWVVTFTGRNSILDKVWEELLLRLISGEMSHLEDITGAVVSRRKREDRISLWTSTQDETRAIAVCRELVQVLLIAYSVSSATTDTFIRNLADGRTGLCLAYLLHEDSLKSLKSYHLKAHHLKAHITIHNHLNELLLV